MLKIFCYITGDDYNLVKNETPESKKKISMYAMIMILPVSLWMIMGFLIVTEIMKGTFAAAACTGAIAGLAIFIIERSIIMSKGRKWIFITRLILGLLISALGALVFDEIIFKNDVEKQLKVNKREYIKEEVSKWTEANNAMIDIQSHETGNYDSLQKAAQEIYLQEINGTGGTGRRGVDIVAKEKYKIYTDIKTIYENEKLKLDSMRNNLESARNEYALKLESESDDGLLLHRIKAMYDLIGKNTAMMIVCLIFSLVILIIELLVVIIKLSSDKTNYERVNEMKEEICKRRISKILNKEPEIFNPSSVYPDVIKFNEYLKDSVTKLF